MTEIAEAKEQAQLDILAWQSEKVSKGENSDLSDSIVKGILTGKSYVKTANDTSFITANGEHEILYSDLYTKIIPTGPKAGESGYVGGYYDDPYIPVGFEHTGNDDWNSGYTIIGKTGTDNAGDEFVWVPCVLNQDRVKEGDTVQTLGALYTGKYKYMGPPITEFEQDQNIRNSVEQYCGFYIAKYEAGINNTKDNYTLYSEAGNDNTALTPITSKPLSQKAKGIWNQISWEDCKTVSNNMIIGDSTGVHSTLISGECWDTTLKWMVNSSSKATENSTPYYYDENSTGKGNYNEDANSGNSWKGNLTTTGASTSYAVNNIYDMAGNAFEYTSEYGMFQDATYAVVRGGHGGGYSGESGPAAYRGYSGNGPTNMFGFRVVLYKEASNS